MPEEQMIKDMYNLMQQGNSSMTAFDGRMGRVEGKVDLLTVKTEKNERTSALEGKTDQLDQTTRRLREQNSLLLQRTDILTEKSNLMSEKIDFISEKTNSIESRLERTEGEVSDLKTKMEAGFSDIHMILENEICTKLNVLFENREDPSRYKMVIRRQEVLENDVDLLKKTVTNHSVKLNKIKEKEPVLSSFFCAETRQVFSFVKSILRISKKCFAIEQFHDIIKKILKDAERGVVGV